MEFQNNSYINRGCRIIELFSALLFTFCILNKTLFTVNFKFEKQIIFNLEMNLILFKMASYVWSGTLLKFEIRWKLLFTQKNKPQGTHLRLFLEGNLLATIIFSLHLELSIMSVIFSIVTSVYDCLMRACNNQRQAINVLLLCLQHMAIQM